MPALPISRLVVNQPSAITAGGSLANGFAHALTRDVRLGNT